MIKSKVKTLGNWAYLIEFQSTKNNHRVANFILISQYIYWKKVEIEQTKNDKLLVNIKWTVSRDLHLIHFRGCKKIAKQPLP